MAKSTRKRTTKSSKAKADAKIEDAVVVSETAPDGEETSVTEAEPAGESAEAETTVDADVGETPEPIAEPDETQTPDDDPVEAVEETPAETPEEPQAPPPAPVPQEVTVQKVGFVPLVGGGIVAAGLGYFAATMGFGQSEPDIEAQVAGQIEALETQIADLPEAPDLSGLESSLETLTTETATQFETLNAAVADLEGQLGEIAALDERLTAVERAPGEEGEITSTAIASFERELEGLRGEITSQETRIQEIADGAAADLAEAQARAAEVEAAAQAAAEEAQAEAEAAMVSAALAELRVALDSGEPYAEALDDLAATGVEVPEALSAAAADGLVTERALAEQFPALARAALATARDAGVADQDAGGLTSFFRNQFDVRSVEPREGDDPDAVLSRAEAALQSGDLDATMNEVNALPEEVRTVFADWQSSLEARNAALAAAAALDPNSSN